ncbi:DUF2238 domain-containing protein [Candidatus Woesearchaeota archaeon]|nr:DUF2238 domain-containing protein [Candidatus Woesearchaeota archaeon]
MGCTAKIDTALEWGLLGVALFNLSFTNYHYLLSLPLVGLFFFFRGFKSYAAKKKLDIPGSYITLGLVAVYLTVIGEFYLELYYRVVYYDKILHFLIPLYLAVLARRFFSSQQQLKELFAVLAVLGAATLWELLEFIIDSFAGVPIMQGIFTGMKGLTGGHEDTMKDISMNLLGAAVGAFGSRVWEQKRSNG